MIVVEDEGRERNISFSRERVRDTGGGRGKCRMRKGLSRLLSLEKG